MAHSGPDADQSQCTLWVLSGQTIAGQNPLLSALVGGLN